MIRAAMQPKLHFAEIMLQLWGGSKHAITPDISRHGTMQLTAEALGQQLELADLLLAGKNRMLEPQDLPGRYGRVVRALDQVLSACGCAAVVGGGWAVWRHGYVARVTQGVDIALPKTSVDEFFARGIGQWVRGHEAAGG
jgi:hypothetical protein